MHVKKVFVKKKNVYSLVDLKRKEMCGLTKEFAGSTQNHEKNIGTSNQPRTKQKMYV
jgi:hypothetical protein